jgi:tetratricopeptide (TPR) repeat protein
MTQHDLQAAAAAIQRGAFDEAKAICERALERDPNNPEALFLLGGALAQSGQTRAAEPVLERANRLAPGHLLILNSLGGVYGANGKPEQAAATLNAALAIDPHFPWALQNLGAACKAMGDFAAARRHFEKALEGHPHLVEALSGLAEIVLLEGDTATALQLAGRVLALAPSHLGAKLVQAEGALNQGKPDEAVRVLNMLQGSAQLAPAEQEKLHALRGRALERLERYDEAFEDFATANRLLYERQRSAFADADSILSPTTVAALADFLLTTDVASWPQAPAGDAPAFLLGFPRSGTTLLDQILHSHPQIETLEESQNFADALEPLITAKGALARWASLTPGDVEAYRQRYWRRVGTALGHKPARDIRFVDKLPLNTVLLPLIHLLFPNAKIIFALRDPRDVVTSCFTQQFQLNAAMFQFLSLETTARYYDAVMRLAETARARLPLDLHVVRYEDVVADFDAEVASLLRFLDLPWDERVHGFHDTARSRLIRTPSAAQVRQPLYASSVARWRRYERQLEPVRPVLEPWVEAYGYA